MSKLPFFSVVVPAHNEEEYIEDTLKALVDVDYPKDQYEVLVIENGSTDKTLEKARSFEGGNLRVYSYPQKGVSAARNRGSELSRRDGDWVLFLDADTCLRKDFFLALSTFMYKHHLDSHSAGSMSVQPISSSIVLKLLFRLGNFLRRFTKFPYTAFLIKRSVLEHIQSDEKQQVGEDVRLFADACQYGPSFFFHTDAVHTSTRRFRKGGALKRSVSWLSMMPLAGRAFREVSYKVIR